MKKNFSLNFKKWDILVIVTSVLVALSLMLGIIFIQNNNHSENRYVHIYHQNQLLDAYTVNFDEIKEVTYITLEKEKFPRLLDDFVIEVNPDKGVRVKEVKCYDNTCKNQGYVKIENLPIVCIPNDVRIVIESGTSIDEIM